MTLMEQIRAKAKAANKCIVLAEGTEERTPQGSRHHPRRGHCTSYSPWKRKGNQRPCFAVGIEKHRQGNYHRPCQPA